MGTLDNVLPEVTSVSPSFLVDSLQCSKVAILPCQQLNQSNAVCFGSALPYHSTSFELVTDANNLEEANKKLLLWSGLKAVPRCWDVIQPLLCSVYFPNCKNNKITLPDRSICELTRGPCQIVKVEYGWPDFLNCQNDDVFRDGCEPQTSLAFNTSDCELPLIATSNPASFYDEVDGCGLQCMNPLFNQEEHDDIHAFVAGWASAACICTFFAMLSFFIDWKNSSKYPARIIFYINLCFFLGGIGWLAQFFAGARDEIVCRKDGTMRLGEPVGTGESPSCVIIFVLVYYFLMSGITWFDILSYSWFLMFKALGTYQDPLIGKAKTFHLVAWSVPFVLMLACLAVSQIDGDSMSGICFIGYKNHLYRLGFLLIPVGLALVIGGFFLFRGLTALLSIRTGHPGLLSESAVSKITWTMIRIGIFALLAFVFVFVTFSVHVYEYTNQALWEKSFREYIKCKANVTILEKLSGLPPVECELQNHPNLSVMKLNLIALFGTGIVMSTWVWTKASAENWRRAWYKLIGRSDNEMKRIRQRSRIIAKAFAHRNILRLNREKKKKEEDFDDDDDDIAGLEYSEHTMSHQDPVGMDFDLHSVSQEMSSTWMRNVPKMVERRGGILPEDKSSVKNRREPDKQSRHIKVKEAVTEPGLWAVSQYIDGSNMKAKINKNKTKKTGPANNPDDVFIGTSPYNFPLRPTPRRLPPVHHHDDHYHHQISQYQQARFEETCLHERDCVNYNPHALPSTLQHGPELHGYAYHPGCVVGEELHHMGGVDVSSNLPTDEINPNLVVPQGGQSHYASYNTNNNGNRVHYFIPQETANSCATSSLKHNSGESQAKGNPAGIQQFKQTKLSRRPLHVTPDQSVVNSSVESN